jgi:hypothetical protein
MLKRNFLRRYSSLTLCLIFLNACGFARAQSDKGDYQPHVGQEGKDVIWVPTPQTLVEKMLDLAKLTPKDYLIDLGSGDGRTVITAAKRGARALGIEYNPDMVELSKRNAAKAGLSDRTNFVRADLFESDFSEAQVITMFLLPEINMRLRPKLLDMKPGTRVVSNSFTMGDWKADETATVKDGCASYCTAHLWIVPAKVDGTWKLPQGELTIKQTYQRFSGSFRVNGISSPITDGRLRGDQISFTARGVKYSGQVGDNTIDGRAGKEKWNATRN